MRRLTHLADHGKLWLGIAGLLGLRPGSLRRAAVRGVASQGLSSLVVNTAIKRFFGRVRPDMANLQAHRRLRREPGTLSFPSGHSSSAAAFVTGVGIEAPAAGALLAPVALGVGYSRVHVGVHYPGDVLAGLAIGAGIALAGRPIARRPGPAAEPVDLWAAPAGDGAASPGATTA
jgi:membrane-associated phospholipid phosphatase